MLDQPIRTELLTPESRKLAIEIIATLAWRKKDAIHRVLAPAGVPNELIKNFQNGRSEITGEKLTKRDGAVMLLSTLDDRPDLLADVIGKLIENASQWKDFELANDQYAAMAVVQKARGFVGTLSDIEARERADLERKIEAARASQRQATLALVRDKSPLLLAQFEAAVKSDDPHQRGYLLESLLTQLLDIYGISAVSSFRRVSGSEQIDGAFSLNGWHYIVECRWRERLADGRQLDGLLGQVGRSGRQTMGMFVSINGWSDNVPDLLNRNREKCIFLVDGVDLYSVLSQRIGLPEMIEGKLRGLNMYSRPHLPVHELIG